MSLFRKGLHIAGRQLVIIAGVVAAIVLLLIGSGAWLSSAVAERKNEIANWASERSGYQIEIGEAGLYWLDFFPKLMLADVNVMTTQQQRPVLAFDSLYIGIDALQSIDQQQAVIDSASVSGLRLAVIRDEQGQFSVRDFDWQSDKAVDTSDKPWLAVLAGLQQVQLQDIDVDYTDALRTNLSGHYQVHYANFTQSGNWLATSLNLTPPQQLGQQLSLSGELLRDGANWPEWEVTVDASQVQLAALADGQALSDVSIEQGRADFRVTASKQADDIVASGLLRLQNTQFQRLKMKDPASDDASSVAASLPQPLHVDYLDTEFNWMRQGETWQLDLQSLDVAINGEAWPQTQLRASADANEWMHLQTNYLRLSDLSAVAAIIDEAPQWLKLYAPAGDVHDLQLTVDNNQQISTLQATVNELGFRQNGDIPGASGLSFTVDWSDTQINAYVDSRDVALYANNWLTDTVYFDTINGHFQWQPQQPSGVLAINALQVVNDDLNIRLNGRFDATTSSDTDLSLSLADFNVANWLNYVPQRMLDPAFLAWANDAFVSGKVDNGEIRLQGDPAAFPYDTQPDAGKFDMMLSVSDVELNYGDGWPHLESVTGIVSGAGNDLQITTDSGRIAGFNFAGVSANIINLVNGLPNLTVEGLLQGEATAGLNFLKNSPLASRFGPIADWLAVAGNTQIKLDLAVPLLDPDATQVSGEISFQDNRLVLNGLPSLAFEQLAGQLNFNNDGLTAEQLKATVAGEPAAMTIQPQAGNTLIEINTAFNAAGLANLWQFDLPKSIFGRSDLQVVVDVAEAQPGDFSVEVKLDSDLQGMVIDLPAPFNKSAESPLPLQIKLTPDSPLKVDVQLADWLTAVAALTDNDIRAAIALGETTARLPANGIVVSGDLATLSVSDWQAWWQQNSNPDADSQWPINVADLRFDRLLWHSLALNDVAVNVRRQPAVWQIKLAAQELKGDINWPASGDSLPTLHFDFVDLALPSEMMATDGSRSQSALWPGFQLNIDNLTLDDMQLGRLQARALRQPLRWQLVSASLQSPTLQATASGDWRRTDDGDNSQLSLQLSSDDLENLLIDLGYQPAISARRVNVNGDFTWPAAPLDFSRQDLRGQMQLDVGSGELKDVEPGAAGRIFGLLSFTAIPRRLSLDFSDLFGSGFSFSRISGSFDFADGLATTNDLQMRGDSALISVTGPINLLERTYNQTVQVTPSVASSLPLAGAVAGGPIGLGVGTAIFLVDKIASNLFDKELVDIITYRYQLTGPWDAPEMKLRTAEQP